ncbi:hypothetical protein ABMA27_012606 [Loxostege sticticalis]|uniref:Sperm protamine P1 n=1 Tax=Loxostege sticticalis TaxID=481309 RepID=A0ABR3GZ76_LOXSC
MAKCRRRRKMCRTRCRSRSGRFKRCRSGDRRYRVQQRCCRARRSCGRRRRRRSGCRRRGRAGGGNCAKAVDSSSSQCMAGDCLTLQVATARAVRVCASIELCSSLCSRSLKLYLWRCRSRSGSFKRCRRCDRRYKIRRRRSRS